MRTIMARIGNFASDPIRERVNFSLAAVRPAAPSSASPLARQVDVALFRARLHPVALVVYVNLARGLTLGPKEGRQVPCILGGEAQSAALKLITEHRRRAGAGADVPPHLTGLTLPQRQRYGGPTGSSDHLRGQRATVTSLGGSDRISQ